MDQTETKTDKSLWKAPSGSDIYQIFIECPDGTIETLNVENHNDIHHVKLQIQTITSSKYLVDKQKLFFAKNELQDRQTLTDANILKNCTLQLSFDRISIYVETQQGNVIHLMVKPDDKIANVKQSISERAGGKSKGYDVDEQKLFNRLNEEELTDNNKMVFLDYGLIQNSLLYVCGAAIEANDKSKTNDINMSSEDSEYSEDDDSDDDDGMIIDRRIANETHKANTRGTHSRPRRAQTLMISKSTQQIMREAHHTKKAVVHNIEASSDESSSSDINEIEKELKRSKKRKPKRKKKAIMSLAIEDDDIESEEDKLLSSDDEEIEENMKQRHRKRKPKKSVKSKPVITIVTDAGSEYVMDQLKMAFDSPLNIEDDDDDDEDEEIEMKRRKKKRKPRKSGKKKPIISLKTSDLTPTAMDAEGNENENEKRRKKKKPKKKKKNRKKDDANFNLFGNTPLNDDAEEEDDIHKLLQEMRQNETNKRESERPQSARPYIARHLGERRHSKSRKRSRSRSKSKKRKKQKENKKYAEDKSIQKKVTKQRPVSASTHSFSGFFGAPNASVMDKINAAHSKRRVSTLQKPTNSRNLRSRSFIAPNIAPINKQEESVNHNNNNNHLQITEAERGRSRGRKRAHTLIVSKSAQSLMKEEHMQNIAEKYNDNDKKWIVNQLNLSQDYWILWCSLQKTRDGKVNGKSMKPFMEKSKLKQSKLSKIWALSDVDRDGKMGFEEFAICVLLMNEAKKGESLPKQLAEHYMPPFFRGKTPMKSASKRSKSTKRNKRVNNMHLAPKVNVAKKRRSEQNIHPVLMKKNKSANIEQHSQSMKSMHVLALDIKSKSVNTLSLRNDIGSNSSMSSMDSSSSDIEPQIMIPEEIKKRNIEDKRMSQMLHEINMDEIYQSEQEQKEFKQKRKKDFDDIFDGLFSDESDDEEFESENYNNQKYIKNKKNDKNNKQIESQMPRVRRAQTFHISKSKQLLMKQQHANKKKKRMTLKELFKICRIKTKGGVYEYFSETLNISYAYEFVDHLPKTITQPIAFKSTKTRMLLNKMSKFVTKQVADDEWNGKYAREWKELASNRMSIVYGQSPLLLIQQAEKERKDREKLAQKYVKSERIYFENQEFENKLNRNSIKLRGNEKCFVNKKIYCNTKCSICVRLDQVPETDSSYHEAHITQIGIVFYDRQHTEYDNVYITDRCGIWRNDAYLTQISISNSVFVDNGSEINLNLDIQRTESIIKFEHYQKNGKLHRGNEKQISLDILQYTSYYCKIFIHQFYGNGSYSIYQITKNPKYIEEKKKKKKPKKKKKKVKEKADNNSNKAIHENNMKLARRQSV